ncbi:MAG: hypothetical protein ACK4WH_00200 [Phycisphaerales bacterium]
MGLLFLICVYIVLGFILAWVAGVVAREEIGVRTGVLILFLTAVISVGARLGIAAVAPGAVLWLSPVVNFGALIVLLHLMAYLSWKHSAIIAAVYTAILFVLGLALKA